MKLMRFSVILILLSFFIASCDNKKNAEKYELTQIKKSLEDYYLHKNASSDYFVKINKLEPISYTAVKDTAASYVARVYFEGIITMTNGGGRKYDIQDTLSVYLNDNFKVLKVEQD